MFSIHFSDYGATTVVKVSLYLNAVHYKFLLCLRVETGTTQSLEHCFYYTASEFTTRSETEQEGNVEVMTSGWKLKENSLIPEMHAALDNLLSTTHCNCAKLLVQHTIVQ